MVYSHKSVIILGMYLIAGVFSGPLTETEMKYPYTTIKSDADFCIFLPPQPGQDIAITEDFGIPFCTTENLVENANLLPEGFIRNAHYAKTNDYIQVTGYFDRSKYSLNETDGGGQYDNHAKGKPIGAQCKDYNYFVNLVEPDIERYCIRCCHKKADCNTGRSGFGCLRVIDGDYSLPNTTIEAINEESSSSLDATLLEASGDVISEETIPNLESLMAELNATTGSLEQVYEKWNTFMDYLTENRSVMLNQIEQLKTVASALTTVDQWKAYLELTADKIDQIQENSLLFLL